MIKLLLTLLFSLSIICSSHAQVVPSPLEITEEDGSPDTYPYKLRVTNGTLTDNLDGTASLSIGGTFAPYDATYIVQSLNGTLTAERVITAGTALDSTDGGAGGNFTLDWDSTEINSTTWGDGLQATNTWTFAVTGTDPTLAISSDILTLNSSFYLGSTKNFKLGGIQWNNGDYIDGTKLNSADYGDIIITNGDWQVENDSHAHTGSTLSGIDISADTNLAVTAPIVLTDDTLSHSAANGYVHTPSDGASTQLLQYSSAGTSKWVTVSSDASIADGGAVTVANDSHDHTSTTLPANTTYLGSTISEGELALTDITTANSSTSAHGFLKKLSNVATEYMDGTGNWTTPTSGSTVTGDNLTIQNVGGTLSTYPRIELNELLGFIKTDEHAVSAYHAIINGFVDVFSDETGVDTATSTNESYDAANDLYQPTTEIDTKLLLHCNGTDGSTTFTDSSSSPHTMTANGNAQIDTAQSKFGGASGLFDGTGDFVDTPDSADWDIGNGNFTAELWVKRTRSATREELIGQVDSTAAAGNISWLIEVQADDTVKGQINTGTTAKIAISTGTITDTNWHHLALVRNGNTLYLYVDGVNDGTADVTGVTANNSAYKLAVGRLGEFDGLYFAGWIDEVRFTNGVARYTTNFTPQTSEFSVYNNMTLVSNAYTANTANPDRALLMLQEEDVDSITINTDLKAWFSEDNGSTFTQITLTDYGDVSSRQIWAGSTDVSAQSGSSIKWKVTSHNNKNLKLHGITGSYQ